MPLAQSQGGAILFDEDKERRAKEEKLMLERMRALTMANPGLGFENMFWEGQSSTRPPDRYATVRQSSIKAAMQSDSQEQMLIDTHTVNSGLS